MSGGRAKLKSRKAGMKNQTQTGDISAVHPIGAPLLELFVVDCKNYVKLGLELWIFGKKGVLTLEWEKLLEDCAISGTKQPLMIVKEAFKGELILTNSAGLDLLKRGWSEPLVPVFGFPRKDIYGVPFVEFLTKADPRLVCEPCQTLGPISSTPEISISRPVILTDIDG